MPGRWQTGKGVPPVTVENPPGLYGTEEGVFAHNLLPADAVLTPARPAADLGAGLTERYALDESRDLKGPLLAAALVLMVLDSLAVFWLGGLFAPPPRRPPRGRSGGDAVPLVAWPRSLLAFAAAASAQDAKPGDAAGDRGDFHDAARLCRHRRFRRRFDQPGRA